MKLISALVATTFALAAPACAAPDKPVAIDDPQLKGAGSLAVSSPDFAAGAMIPARHTSYGQSVSPALAWSGAPAATRSFALIVQDPDAPTPKPFVHWMLWNLPGSAAGLADGAVPDGARQGKLMFVGTVGYMGPRPPAGPAHHYHFQVFALDRPLETPQGAELPALTAAMAGHVLASGELVALSQKP